MAALTPVVTLRLATARDAAAMAAIYAPAVSDRATSFELTPPDGHEMARRLAALGDAHPWLVAVMDGEVAGYAYASPHRERAAYRWSVDVSAYVRPEVQRVGLGRRLYHALFTILSAQGYRNAYAGITLPNAASEGLHRAIGFTPVGVYRHVGYKMDRWHDVMWLERAIGDDTPVAPDELRSVSDVLTQPAVAAALGGGAPAHDTSAALQP